jgi:ribosomal protein S18 acetylase RimI-like enzyme
VLIRAVDPRTDEELAAGLLTVQRAAYAVEAGLIGDERIPPLRESLEELRRAPLSWVGAFLGERLAGAVAWSDDPGLLEIERLVVAPAAHRRGVGSTLVRAALAHAGARPTTVSTGRDNRPARTLYERLGFVATGELEVLPGLWTTQYRRHPASPPRGRQAGAATRLSNSAIPAAVLEAGTK